MKAVKFLQYQTRPSFHWQGIKNWKDATIAYNTHLRSDCHKERCEILELRNTTSDVAEQLSKKYKEENELNWMMLIKILQTDLFLARQGLPLRGQTEWEDCNYTAVAFTKHWLS